MGPSLYRTTLVAQTRVALDALLSGHSAERAWEPDVLALVLERWGDALRLGEGRAVQVERRLHGITAALLARVAAERVEEAREWALPEPGSADDEMIDDLAVSVTRRDETESLLDAATRWVGMSRGLVVDIAGVDELLATLDAFDVALARIASRDLVEAALGARVVLHQDGSWLARLPQSTAEATGPAAVDTAALPADVEIDGRPSHGATDAYVRTAKLAAYVERAAQRDPLYAEELALTIDALLGCDEQVAWRARTWRRRYQPTPAPRNLNQVAVAGPEVLAAASEQASLSAERGYQSLGALPGVAAEADLRIEGEQLVVRAYPASLRELRVNALVGERTLEDGCWTVSLPFQRGLELRVCVVDEHGALFEDTLQVT